MRHVTDLQSLDDLRESGPYPVVSVSCLDRLGYAAPHPTLDQVLFGTSLIPKTSRTGGFSDIDGYQQFGQQPIRPVLGYPSGSPEAKRQERQRITASGDGRYTFNCGGNNCKNKPVYKMPTLIDRYLEAHTDSDHRLLV